MTVSRKETQKLELRFVRDHERVHITCPSFRVCMINARRVFDL